MGWCSGSNVYEPIERAILKEEYLEDVVKVRLLKSVISALQNNDWDCEMDSFNPTNPIVVEAFGLVGLLEPYEDTDVLSGIAGSKWTHMREE